jgi:hypothetical protein
VRTARPVRPLAPGHRRTARCHRRSGLPPDGWPRVSPSALGPPCRLACLVPGQPRARLGEPASHVWVIHAA